MDEVTAGLPGCIYQKAAQPHQPCLRLAGSPISSQDERRPILLQLLRSWHTAWFIAHAAAIVSADGLQNDVTGPGFHSSTQSW